MKDRLRNASCHVATCYTKVLEGQERASYEDEEVKVIAQRMNKPGLVIGISVVQKEVPTK